MNNALEDFVAEMKAQGIWNKVTVVSASDFARTLTSNGKGTDHAWAGQHFIMGGSVQGGKIYNDFPPSLQPGNDQDAGRGRLIPKYPWESMLVPVSTWMGVPTDQRGAIFPNLANFDSSCPLPNSKAHIRHPVLKCVLERTPYHVLKCVWEVGFGFGGARGVRLGASASHWS